MIALNIYVFNIGFITICCLIFVAAASQNLAILLLRYRYPDVWRSIGKPLIFPSGPGAIKDWKSHRINLHAYMKSNSIYSKDLILRIFSVTTINLPKFIPFAITIWLVTLFFSSSLFLAYNH